MSDLNDLPPETVRSEKKPDISDYAGHFALDAKNRGSSKELLGRVCLVGFLVNDRSSAWAEKDVEKMKQVLQTVAQQLEEQSRLPGNRLQISFAFDSVPVQYKYNSNSYGRVVKDVLEQYGYSNAAAYQEHYKKKFKKHEVPLVFFINRDFRSFALADGSEDDGSGELCFVAFNDDLKLCVRTLMHEVLHQFGAIDYYLPEQVKSTAEKLFPQSIMLHGYEVDDLTRYLVGWDETPSESALEFLSETSGVTSDDIYKAYVKDKDNDW